MGGAVSARTCPRCGRNAPEAHPECAEALVLEPPRFCDECGRRLRVQVYPESYEARCPDHGDKGGPLQKV